MKIIYLLPLGYFLATRVPGHLASASWIAVYIVPLLMIGSFSPLAITDAFAIQWLAIVAIYTVYEVGYLQNDALTTRSETSPTLRLTPAEMTNVQRLLAPIILVRIFILAALLVVLYALSPPGFNGFVICLACIIPVFLVYNLTRGPVNVPLHFLLVSLRFTAPVVVLFPQLDLLTVVYLLLLFPIINTLERAAEPRYGLTWAQRNPIANQSSGRWQYYLGLSMLWAGTCLALGINLMTLIPIVYLFAYRLLSPLLVPTNRSPTA